MPTLTSYFNDMDDPRGGNAPRHKFCDLMTISLLCALCGGETAVDMELFGQMKENLAISRFVWVAWNRVMRARHQMLWCRVRLAGG